MARGLLGSHAIELAIIAPGPVKRFVRQDYRHVEQWLIPVGCPLGHDGLPSDLLVQAILVVVKKFSPDLIHIWGTETFWGLLSARRLLVYPTLLEMQGLKYRIAKVFFGGLTLSERLCCVGIKELLKRRTMRADQRNFECWGLLEEEMIRSHYFISVQSAWMAAQVKAINPDAYIFPIDLVLRGPFYDPEGWQPPSCNTIFCSTSYTSPFKGLHVAVRALGILRKRIPDARLRIAGAHQRPGIRQDGYMRWINRLIQELGLISAIDWLGPLDAEQIVAELKKAAAVVIPTFIENCCTAMQEAMAIGTPVVVSHAGGIPSLGRDEESCLFFTPGDEAMCAYQLGRVLTEDALAQRLSMESRKIAAIRNDRQRIVQRQSEIYLHVIADSAENIFSLSSSSEC